MLATLAAVSVSNIIWGLFLLLIVVACFAVLWYGFNYLASVWGLPELAVKVVHTIFVLALIAALLFALLSLANPGAVVW